MKMKTLRCQNTADLEFPSTDPVNAPARAEFKLGLFQPDHHAPPATTKPTPAATPRNNYFSFTTLKAKV